MERARARLWLAALIAAFSVLAPTAVEGKVQTRPAQVSEGTLLIAASDSAKRKAAAFPLAKTRVDVHVLGFTSQVRVRQTFNNPFSIPLEAVYVFPLPQNAAVGAMSMRIGKRRITAVIKTRTAARAAYARAKRDGRRTALLEQERPNIFTQSVANIAPGKEIVVELVYDVPLRYHAGVYEFVYPMVVGPRYVASVPKVTDAARITPPVTPPGSRSGHEVSVQVSIDAGLPIKKLSSPTHKITVTRPSSEKNTAVQVGLAKGNRIPNKDFVVRFTVAGKRPAMAVRAAMSQYGGHFALMFEPPLGATGAGVTPKEIVFVIDTSASMRGEPLTRVKNAMRYALRNLNPRDTFRIIRFGDSASSSSSAPLANNKANVQRALTYINGLIGGGGTQMMKGIRAALGGRADGRRLRVVCLMTDGYIGSETRILREVAQTIRPDTRLFAFGVGSAVNRYLLERMSELGRGATIYSLHDDKPTKALKAFYDRIRSPVLTHIRVDWDGLDARDVSPSRIPDLFAGQPLVLVGRYKRAGEAVVKIHGRLGGKPVRFVVPVTLPAKKSGNKALARTWARNRIEQLSLELLRKPTTGLVAAITKLALGHSLMSKYTSLVAVEKIRRRVKGIYRTYYVPVAMPVGVSHEAVFGKVSAKAKGGKGGSYASTVSRVESARADRDQPANTPMGKRGGGAGLGMAQAIVAQRRSTRGWQVGVGAGFGVQLSQNTAISSANVQLNRNVARNISLGSEVLLQAPSLSAGDAMVSVLLDLVYAGLLDDLLSLTVGAGALLPGEGFGVAYSGALDFKLPFNRGMATGLKLRLDGNRRRGALESQHSLSVGVQLSW